MKKVLLLILMMFLMVVSACDSKNDDDNNQQEVVTYTYNDFTAGEKAMFNQVFNEVIPFIPNNEYYVEAKWDYIEFKTVGNTNVEFENYKASLVSAGYINTAWSIEDGYTYVKGEITLTVSYKTLEAKNYVYVVVYKTGESLPPQGGEETPVPTVPGGSEGGEETTLEEIVYTITTSVPEGLTYITNNPSYQDPDMGSAGGIKLRFEGQGIKTEQFTASNKVYVAIVVGALYENTKTGTSTDYFTVKGYDVSGNVVDTKVLNTVVVGNNLLELSGSGIVSVEVIMTGYPYNGSKYCNTLLTGLIISGSEIGSTPNIPDDTPTPVVPSTGDALTIAEFLSKKDTTNYYKLTGTVTNIVNTTYGNFTLVDDSGSIYVYGLLPYEGATDKQSFASLGITEGAVITLCGCYKNYNGSDEVSGAYLVEIVSSGSGSGNNGGGNGGTYSYTSFSSEEQSLFTTYIGEVIPFLANNEYYVEGYYDVDDYENGMCFYTIGNTSSDFEAYLDLLEASGYDFYTTEDDEYGDTWYTYIKNDDIVIDAVFFTESGENYVNVLVYSSLSSDNTSGSEGGENGGSTESDVDLITNNGKGLPEGVDGVHSVDFTQATNVKNVADQGYYLGGCPTTGDVKVLVIPVEFSDATASSLGYDINKIKTAFNGVSGTTDYYSVSEYYFISSYEKLNLEFVVLDSWFRPDNTSSYYLEQKMDYYGSEVECGDQMIINEALAYLEPTMDLKQFDSDNNGMIDAVVLINTLDIDGDVTMKWAYRYWNIYTDSEGYYYEYDEVSANDFLWASYKFLLEEYDASGNAIYNDSNINTYTYIHEFGHILGADDYYDTSYTNEPLLGCDIMDSMTGDHNAFTKFNLGWLTTSKVVVASDSVTLTLEDFSKNGDTIIIANNWDDALGAYQEYYVLMYYKNTGLNGGDHGYFYNDGIVVYHVNASLYKQEEDGEVYYDIYYNNTDASDQYGTEENLIEFVKSPSDTVVYTAGMTSSSDILDDNGNKISYVFKVDSITEEQATITFTKNN